ncbi:hypothetical protein HRbin33_01457 [bacterium HR33]|nr:hypothetical protein HRbin33_01457 [bacterium HR33]
MRIVAIFLLSAIAGACGAGSTPVGGEPGTPLPDLPDTLLAKFFAGRALFDKVYTPEEGLGPMFNENQCSACHTSPASGGTGGFERVVKATRFGGPGDCDPLADFGGENIRTQATPRMKALGFERESVPAAATEVGHFLAPPLFGLGLVEAIPEEEIVLREDPDDRDGDGISGRAARTRDGRLARFGRKGEFATLREFVETALRLEMGLTTRAEDVETFNGRPVPRTADPTPEPEVDSVTVDLLAAFVRFLAPAAPLPPRSGPHRDTLEAGRRLFESIGCTSCHVPTMRTGRSPIPALDRKTVALYSDLLLHDMGPGLASVCAFDASPTELRTPILAGLSSRSFYLHDGRAIDLRDAILAHGGEAQRARDAFARLPWLRQEYLIRFLKSL